MRVTLIVEWMDAGRGGAETSTIQFVRHLVDLGVDVCVLTRSKNLDHLPCSGQIIDAISPGRSTATMRFAREADKAALATGHDLIHALVPSMVAHVYQPRGGTYRETQIRNIATRRSPVSRAFKRVLLAMDMKQQTMARFEQQMLQRPACPHVIALSDYVIKQLRTHYQVPPEKITKIFNGVDPLIHDEATRQRNRAEIRSQYNVADSETLALMAANNLRLKGADTWLRALARLKDSTPIRSIIVGNGRAKRWIALAQQLGVADRITFAGHTDDIAPFYHAADLLVHPTFYDPCSRVVLEAKSVGLPCVTTGYDGAAEAIEEGVDGFVIESPGDVDALAGAVGKIIESANRFKSPSRESNVQGITMREHTEQVVQLYERLLSEKRPSCST